MRLTGREAQPEWISQKPQAVARSGPFIAIDHRGPRRTWKMYETQRRGWGSMKIDYLSLCCGGSPVECHFFCPCRSVCWTDARGGRVGFVSSSVWWEIQALLFTDEIAWHKHWLNEDMRPQRREGKTYPTVNVWLLSILFQKRDEAKPFEREGMF